MYKTKNRIIDNKKKYLSGIIINTKRNHIGKTGDHQSKPTLICISKGKVNSKLQAYSVLGSS